jgi:hypothetical protein
MVSQRNSVWEWLTVEDFDPSEFEWVEERDQEKNLCSKLVHRPTDSWCAFTINFYGLRITIMSPGLQHRVEQFEAGDQWLSQLETVRSWMVALRREMQPDRWSVYAGQNDLHALAESADRGSDSRFTRQEQRDIANQLEQIKTMLARLPGRSAAQLADANAKLDYLTEQARHQGKRQWFFTAIGVLATVAMGMNMAVEEARALFQLMGQGLRAIGVG